MKKLYARFIIFLIRPALEILAKEELSKHSELNAAICQTIRNEKRPGGILFKAEKLLDP